MTTYTHSNKAEEREAYRKAHADYLKANEALKQSYRDNSPVLSNEPNSLLNKLLVKIRNKHRGMRKAMKEGSALLYPFRLIKLVLFWMVAFFPVWYLSAFYIMGDMFNKYGVLGVFPAMLMFPFMMIFPLQLGLLGTTSVGFLYLSGGDIAAWYDRYSALFALIWTGWYDTYSAFFAHIWTGLVC